MPKTPTRKNHRSPSGRFASKPKSRTLSLVTRHLSFVTSKFKRKSPLFIILLLLPLLLLIYIFKDLPSPTRLASLPAASTQIMDRNGELLYNIFSDENRIPISLNDLPDHVKQATIAIEDKSFYEHQGLAVTGIARASLKNVRYAFCRVFIRDCSLSFQGGSTITQQLVKTALLTPERTVRRKIRELILTLVVEIIYSKDEILEMYLNQVPYGGTSYGIESAAQTYFGKHAKDLTLSEASLLAGLPQAPTRYSPFGAHPELAKNRQQLVLDRMVEDGYISPEQKDEALNQQLIFAPAQVGIRAPHFVLYVKDQLVQKYGEQTVERGGLKVTTTLDITLQESAQEIVASEVAKLKSARVGNSAALVTNPASGEILAMVGSHNYFDKEHDGNVNVTLAHRQPGSSIKPLNYALGIENNIITPASLILDTRTCFGVAGQRAYCPDNYDNTFHGATQARFALGNSYNIPAVKMLALNGLENFIIKARELGITTFSEPSNYGLSLTLGGGEVRMVDMAVAFGVLANSGTKVELHPILKVEDSDGKVLEEYDPYNGEGSQTSFLRKFTQSVQNILTPSNIVLATDEYIDSAQGVTLTNNQKQATIGSEKSGVKTLPYIAQANTPTPKIIPDGPQVLSPETTYLISHILLDNNARSAAFGSSSFLNVAGHPEVSVKTGTTNDKRDNWTIGYNPDRLTVVWVGNNDNTPLGAVASGITGASPIWNRIMRVALKDLKPNWPIQPEGVIGKSVCSLSGLLPPDPANPASCHNGQFRFEYFKRNYQPIDVENIRRDIPIDKTTGIPSTEKTPPENVEMQNHPVVFDILGQMFCLDCPISSESATIRAESVVRSTPTPISGVSNE